MVRKNEIGVHTGGECELFGEGGFEFGESDNNVWGFVNDGVNVGVCCVLEADFSG